MRATWIGPLAVVLAAILWGTTGTVQGLLPEDRAPLAVGALRLWVGALALMVLALARGETRRGLRRLPRGGCLVAGLLIAGYNLLFFRAVSEAGVGVGTAITIGSAPLWATAYEVMVLKLWPGGRRALGQIAAILGVACLGVGSAAGGGAPIGVALALGAGACYAGYSVATSRMSGHAPTTSLAAGTFGVAALATLPVLALVPLGWLAAPGAVAGIVFLGVGATGLSYALYTWGLGRVTASTAVTLALAEPVTAWILATWIMSEPVTAPGIGGIALIVLGLSLVASRPPRT